jgi:hypothetical protein
MPVRTLPGYPMFDIPIHRNTGISPLTPSLIPPQEQVLGNPGEEGEAGFAGGGDLRGTNGQLNHKVIG